MKLVVYILLSLFCVQISGANDQLSVVYIAGPHLIYDCHAQIWVCTSDSMSESCEDVRAADIRRSQKILRCGKWKKYVSTKECIEGQKERVNSAVNPMFCLHERAKKHFIDFK